MEDLINKDNNEDIKNVNNENDEIQTDNKENEALKKLKILEQKINNQNLIINEYDNQIEQLRNNFKIHEKNVKTLEEKEIMKSKQKLTKNLKLKSKSLYINLNDLQEQQNHIQLGTSIDLPLNNQNKDKLRNIKQEKEIIQNKLSEINSQIKIINDNEKVISIPKIKIQKRYADEIGNKDYINKNLPTTLLKSSNTTFFKSLDEIMQKEKEEIAEKTLKKMEKIKMMRIMELYIIKKRKKRIDNLEKINTQKYIIRKDYLSPEEKEQKRLMEEELLVDREKRIRRMKLFPISSEELNRFSRNVRRNEKIIQEELGVKKNQMKQLWQIRKNLLPEFKSKFYDYNKEKEDKERELKLKEEKQMNEMKKIQLSEKIIKKMQPSNNYILQNGREEKIKKLLGIDKFNDIKQLDNKIRLNSQKISLIQPKNFDTSNKFSIDKASGRKKIKKLIPLERPIDYLNDNEKGIKRRDNSPENNSYSNVHKWEKMLKDDNEIYNNIEKIKTEANLLGNKAEAKRQILEYKINSGKTDEIDELNNEISNLYIASMQAKFQILKKMGKNA